MLLGVCQNASMTCYTQRYKFSWWRHSNNSMTKYCPPIKGVIEEWSSKNFWRVKGPEEEEGVFQPRNWILSKLISHSIVQGSTAVVIRSRMPIIDDINTNHWSKVFSGRIKAGYDTVGEEIKSKPLSAATDLNSPFSAKGCWNFLLLSAHITWSIISLRYSKLTTL